MDLGTLETMLVEGSATEEDRADEGLCDAGDTGGGSFGGSGGRHLLYDTAPTGGVGNRGGGSGGSHHSGLTGVMAGGHRGPLGGQQRISRQAELGSADDSDNDCAKEQDDERGGDGGEGGGRGGMWSEGEEGEEEQDDDDEDEDETEDAEADEGEEEGTSDSVSGCGRDDETDSSGPSTS